MNSMITRLLFVILISVGLQNYAAGNPKNNEASISIESITAQPGDTVQVSVTATGFNNIGAADIRITFNENVLGVVDPANPHTIFLDIHPKLAGALINLFNSYTVALSFTSWMPANIPDGEKLFDLQFIFCNELYPCALDGTASSLDFVESQTHFTTSGFLELPLEYNNGEISATTLLKALTITQNGLGHVEVDDVIYEEPVVVDENTVLSLEAFPGNEWLFSGWSGDITGTENPADVIMNDHKNVTVTFSTESEPEQYTLTIITAGEGDVTVDPDKDVYNMGDVITLTPDPAAGWQFAGWTGDTQHLDGHTLTMPAANVFLTADFTEIPPEMYTLTINITGLGDVTIDGQVYPDQLTLVAGTTLSLEALPGEWWVFEGWSGDLGGTDNPQTLVMDANKEVNALFISTVIYIQDALIPAGETECYDDVHTIITAGDGTEFIVQDGALVHMAAAHNIIFREGTTIEAGSRLWAYIDADFPFCDLPAHFLAQSNEQDEAASNTRSEQLTGIVLPEGKPGFNVYPNPTHDAFTLALQGFADASHVAVEVFDMFGNQLFVKEVATRQNHVFSLDGAQPGIYLVRVTWTGNAKVKRLLKK